MKVAGCVLCIVFALSSFACSHYQKKPATQNALSQHTGAPGSTVPRAGSRFYLNTAGNIVAPPGNPAGNPPGSPPIVGGTMAQQSMWP
ncbi:MAG: hypothetical protein L0H94_14975 [Nitrospira sp.]|nr:hypothetical protein [Nitrospira sp.]